MNRRQVPVHIKEGDTDSIPIVIGLCCHGIWRDLIIVDNNEWLELDDFGAIVHAGDL